MRLKTENVAISIAAGHRVSPYYLRLHQKGDEHLFLSSYFCIEDVIKK